MADPAISEPTQSAAQSLGAGDAVLHWPSGETWLVLGVSTDGRRVCIAGWPPTVAEARHCRPVRQPGVAHLEGFSPEFRAHRRRAFGESFVDGPVETPPPSPEEVAADAALNERQQHTTPNPETEE
jgi:hypothetical protein